MDSPIIKHRTKQWENQFEGTNKKLKDSSKEEIDEVIVDNHKNTDIQENKSQALCQGTNITIALQNKLKTLKKKKKEVIKRILKRIERGPRRIMRKCMNRRKPSYTQENEDQSQQVQSQFQNQSQNTNLSELTEQKQRRKSKQKIQQVNINDQTHQQMIIIEQSKSKTKRDRTGLIYQPVLKGQKAFYKVIRNNNGFKYFSPQFTLFHEDSKKQFIFAKKVSPYTFIISMSKSDWKQQSNNYVGKLVSNLSGSILHLSLIFRDNLHFQKQQKIICTIQYSNSFFDFRKPRTIKVYYFHPFDKSLQKLGKIMNIKQQYYKKSFSEQITYFQSRKPHYNPHQKSYNLDFYGRADISSIKNCILEDVNHRGRDYLLFGKIKPNQYNLDLMYPLTPLVAFAISLSNFNGKIICE